MDNHRASLDSVFHALADPTRRAILHCLGNGPASVSELAKPFDMALPSFMKHLHVLENSGLIQSKKTGRVRTCEISPARLAQAEFWLVGQRKVWEGRTDRLEAYVTQLQSKESEE